jgi:hypothetical protein
MRFHRLLLAPLAVAVVTGTAAAATPSHAPSVGLRPSAIHRTISANRSSDRSGAARRSEASAAPALTGLANAIWRVSANLAAHPNNGLSNALAHLRSNQARHATGAHGHHDASEGDGSAPGR